jgi:rod shape-determining protein MreB
MGRTSDKFRVVRALRGGAITDFGAAQAMCQYCLRKVRNVHRLSRPIVGLGVPSPSWATDRGIQAVKNAVKQVSIRDYLDVENTMTAVGSGFPVNKSSGIMVVDIGGRTIEAAVIAFDGIVVLQSIRVADDEMNDTILSHIEKLIG